MNPTSLFLDIYKKYDYVLASIHFKKNPHLYKTYMRLVNIFVDFLSSFNKLNLN